MTRFLNLDRIENGNAIIKWSLSFIGIIITLNFTSGDGSENSTMKNFTPFHWNSSSAEESKKWQTPIIPIITNVNHTEAMERLRDLWVTQKKHFENVKNATRQLCKLIGQDVEAIGYLFEEIDPLLERQIKVLTKKPWENTDLMYEVVDDWLIDQQRRSWLALGRCLTDQYDFLDSDHKVEEKKLRILFDKAQEDLLDRRKSVVSAEKSAQKLDGFGIEYNVKM